MNTIEIYNNIEVKKIYNKIDIDIKSITIDTRKIKKNDCYIGILGDTFNGNDFYLDALKKGAVLAIVENEVITPEVLKYLEEEEKSVIIVESSRDALGSLAKYKRSLFKHPVITVTGSSGKTSTKDIIYSVLKEKYNVHKTIGNQNNDIGLPLSILSLEDDTEILVLEIGMNHLREIAYLTDIAKPNVAVITNVGTAHIGNLGSRENILKAKLEILEGLDKDGTLIINNDNDLLHDWYLKNKSKYNIKTIGINNKSDLMAGSINLLDNGSNFMFDGNLIEVPVGGEHFIYNSLVALAIGSIFDIDLKHIQKGIKNFELSQNRMDIEEANGITIINDSYNANFDSLKYGIKYLSSLHGRRIAVIGTMLELGDYSNMLHTSVGDIIYDEDIDILITVGEYTDLINKRAEELGFNKENSYHFLNNQDAINLINSIKTKDDKILVKASARLNFKEIVEKIK